MSKFKVGGTYQTRSIGDADCVILATMAKRTAKTVTLAKAPLGNQSTFRVSIRDGVEQFAPWGSYSMSPTMRADRVAK